MRFIRDIINEKKQSVAQQAVVVTPPPSDGAETGPDGAWADPGPDPVGADPFDARSPDADSVDAGAGTEPDEDHVVAEETVASAPVETLHGEAAAVPSPTQVDDAAHDDAGFSLLADPVELADDRDDHVDSLFAEDPQEDFAENAQPANPDAGLRVTPEQGRVDLRQPAVSKVTRVTGAYPRMSGAHRPAEETPAPQPTLDVPPPAAGRAARRAGRAKTRLLGFGTAQESVADPLAAAASPTPSSSDGALPVGWMAVIDGPGRGAVFTLHEGVAQLGRGEDQAVRLDFGDTSISRSNHAAVAYDPEQKSFFVGHGGKANLVRLNDRPVLSTETMQSGDTLRIGETTLRFIALCGSDFDWGQGSVPANRVSHG